MSGIKLEKLEFNSGQLSRRLEQLHSEFTEKFDIVAEEVCKDVLENAISRCPVDSGALRDSGYIEKDAEGKYTVGFSAPYASIVHEKPSDWVKTGETQFLVKAIRDVCGSDGQKIMGRLREYE